MCTQPDSLSVFKHTIPAVFPLRRTSKICSCRPPFPGALLQSPSCSPFALALHSANVVLVVPNRHCSIYTRLWCAYEGYLAQEAGKPILVARRESRRGMVSSASGDIRGLSGCRWVPQFTTQDIISATLYVFNEVLVRFCSLRMSSGDAGPRVGPATGQIPLAGECGCNALWFS
jgi:hypothetical protein